MEYPSKLIETAVEEVTEQVESAVEEVQEAVANLDPSQLLTAENFDADKVSQLIKDANISPAIKPVLEAAIQSVKDDPAKLDAVLTQIRSALGL